MSWLFFLFHTHKKMAFFWYILFLGLSFGLNWNLVLLPTTKRLWRECDVVAAERLGQPSLWFRTTRDSTLGCGKIDLSYRIQRSYKIIFFKSTVAVNSIDKSNFKTKQLWPKNEQNLAFRNGLSFFNQTKLRKILTT